MKVILEKFTREFEAGRDVPAGEAETFFDAVLAESDEAVLDRLLRAWNAKGTSEDELFSLASIMRGRCIPVSSNHDIFVDVVGTGGSGAKRFNVSTAAAFVIAGAGVAVAKHGNRAATSSSGSADVLSSLSVDPAIEPSAAELCLNKIGICFMFAPNHHRLSPTLAMARKKLGAPTIFNNLGPLCNPANAPFQVIGVWNERLVEPTARVLARLGTKRSWVVHGSDGLDELTLSGRSLVAEVCGGEVRTFEIRPEDMGTDTRDLNGLACSSPEESAAMIRSILDGSCSDQAAADLVKMNSAAALYLAGAATSLKHAFELSAKSLESGAAFAKMEQLAAATNAKTR